MTYDLRPQLLGRTLYDGVRPQTTRGPMHLFDHLRPVAIQRSLLVYDDGTVVERAEFGTWEINRPNVIAFILGGTDFRCEPGPVHDALIAAGYTCGWGNPVDHYPVDDTYPSDDEYPTPESEES